MYTCQCEGLQMGQSNGVLLKEVAVVGNYPSKEAPLHSYCTENTHISTFPPAHATHTSDLRNRTRTRPTRHTITSPYGLHSQKGSSSIANERQSIAKSERPKLSYRKLLHRSMLRRVRLRRHAQKNIQICCLLTEIHGLLTSRAN